MDRKELILTLRQICEEIAKENGYTQYSEYDADCGLWDNKKWTGSETTMTSIIESEYGKLTEFKFHNGNADNEFVGMRYRFSNPCLHIRYRNDKNFECMASLEFSDGCYEDGEYTHNGEYSLHEYMCWKPEGIRLGEMLLDKCRKHGISVD